MKWIFETKNDGVLTIARLVLGGTMWAHGAQKMLGWFGGYGWDATIQGMGQMGLPAFVVMLVIIAEFFGGLALILGFFARFSAFWNGVILAVAAVMVHLPNGFFNGPIDGGGTGWELHLLAVTLAFIVTVRGAGAWSLDRVIARSQTKEHLREERLPAAGARI